MHRPPRRLIIDRRASPSEVLFCKRVTTRSSHRPHSHFLSLAPGMRNIRDRVPDHADKRRKSAHEMQESLERICGRRDAPFPRLI